MTWISKDKFEVSIDMVNQIMTKEDEVDGVQVIYHIGSVVHQ